MSTVMANFMVSLGSMDNNEIMLNLAALGTLVITIAANVSIYISQTKYYANLTLGERLISIVSMLILLVLLCSSSIMVRLIDLLNKSVNFNGVREFDSSKIQSLSSQEPPNRWSLPVVTLTSIAISLPNVTQRKSKQLFTAVSEGLYFTRLIQKTLDSNGELENIRKAADVVWVGVEFYKKWQDEDLKVAGRTQKEMLQALSSNAEKTVKNFTNGTNFLLQDPQNWPAKVIAANSMYRITQTILLAHDNDHPQTDEELFERLSIIISDILAACFTNLARVIMLLCHSNSIKEREKSIRQAAVLLGESEEILETLRELPNVDSERAASIETYGLHVSIEL